MKNCLHCGKEFEPPKPKSVYCSTKCRTYAFRERQIEKKIQKIADTPEFKASVNKIINKATGGWEGKAKVSPVGDIGLEKTLEIMDQIAAIQKEIIPEGIKSEPGRKYWRMKQKQKIDELKKLL